MHNYKARHDITAHTPCAQCIFMTTAVSLYIKTALIQDRRLWKSRAFRGRIFKMYYRHKFDVVHDE